MVIGIEDIWQIKYGPLRRICRLRNTDREHETIVHGIMVLCKIMEGIRLIEYGHLGQIFVEHRTLVQGIRVLRKM